MRIISGKALTNFLLLIVFTIPTFGQAVWKQYNGPFSGDVNSFATYGDTIYAGSRLTGVFRSLDGGEKWSVILPEITYVHSLQQTDTSLLIGTSKLYSLSQPGNILNQLGQAVTGAIGHMQRLNGKLFVSTDFGIYKYEPSSNTLVLKTNGLTDQGQSLYWTRDLAAVDDVLFCNVINTGIFRSVDEGEYWEKLDVASGVQGLQFLVGRNDSLFCGGGGSLYVSDDKGVNWTNIAYDLPSNLTVSKLEVTSTSIFISTTGGVYKSQKGSTHWSKVNDKRYDALTFDGTRLFASDKRGVYTWDDGTQQFILSNTGINTSRVNGIALFDEKIYSATESGVHFSDTQGMQWSIVPELDGVYTKAIAKTDTSLFAGTSVGLYVTSTGSPGWRLCENGMPDTGIWDIKFAGDKIYVASDDGLYVSRNGGSSWRLLANSQSPNAQILHIGVTDKQLVAGNNAGLYKILPDSSDWQTVNFFEGKSVASINIIDSVIYASSENAPVYRSSDYCETWSVVDIPVISSVDIIKRGDNIYACSFNKILYSADGGLTWDLSSETGIPPEINLTCIIEGDSAFYVGSYGKSIFRRPFLALADISSDVYEISDTAIFNIPENTTLSDFKSNITIAYGASVELEKNESTSGRTNTSEIIETGDRIKISAEDGKNEKILSVAKKALVTSIAKAEVMLSVFPVPAKDILYFNHPEAIRSFYLSDVRGKKITGQLSGHDYINTSTLPNGFYILTILNHSNERQVFRFVKE